MSDANYIDRLKETLLTTVPYSVLASGGRFVLTKCVFCSDGKNHDSRHLYINVEGHGTLPWCYCHICHNSALLTSDFISTYFGIYDMELLTSNTKYFKTMYNTNRYKNSIGSDKPYKLNNTYITKDELSNKKLQYINNRIGTNITYEDLSNLKIVLNLYDILKSNRIETLTRDSYIVQELDKSFIGFVSTDNAFINMRNLRVKSSKPPLDKRYVNYNIFNKFDNTQRFYIIPTNIDLNNPNPIRINIAEGPFDILSIYHNMNINRDHSIFASVNGSGYINLIKHFINRLKLINIELHIYRDNDMKYHIINRIVEIMRPYFIDVYLHSNIYQNEKDFGVPPNRIKEEVVKIS